MRVRVAVMAMVSCLTFAPQPAPAQETPPDPLTATQVQALSAAIAQSMEGRTFSVDTGKDGMPASGKDVVRFEDGMMSTALCTRFGFKPAPYSVRVEGTKVLFHSEMISDTQGRLVFNGHIEGDRLVARAEWAQVRWYWTIDVVLWFDGKQVPFSDSLPAFIN